MHCYDLKPHLAAPPKAVRAVRVEVVDTVDGLRITYSVEGAEALVVPSRQLPARADGLWQATCFELFLQAEGSNAYAEFNFAPSLRWAAYRFECYRGGMRAMPLRADPHIDSVAGREPFVLAVNLELGAGLRLSAMHMGLSAVIEEIDGTKSYWALAHAPGRPDFHNRDCFIATLPAPADP